MHRVYETYLAIVERENHGLQRTLRRRSERRGEDFRR